MNWIEQLEHAIDVRSRKDGIAVYCGKNQYSWSELYASIRDAYNQFRKEGVGRESRVFLRMDDFSFPMISSFMAMCFLQCLIIPLRVPRGESERVDKLSLEITPTHIVEVYDAEICITRCVRNLDERPTEDDINAMLGQLSGAGIIFASSGTTGTPKLILQDINKLFAKYKIRPRCGRNRSALLLLSDHIGGINTLMANLAAGSTSVVIADRSASAVTREVEDKRITTLPASPSFLRLMLNHSRVSDIDVSSVKLITYGSERMSPVLLQELQEGFPNVRFIQTYGSTELGILATRDTDNNFFHLDLDDEKYRVEDDELRVRKPDSFIGYVGRKMEDANWLKTGDIVDQTKAGAITVVARKDDIINVGGEKVYPAEVEQALEQCGYVSGAMVFGESNPLSGQIVCAQIVCTEPHMKTSQLQTAIFAALKGKIEQFKLPTKIQIVENFAMNRRLKRMKTQDATE